MSKKTLIILVCLITFATGCVGPGVSDYGYDLINGYEVVRWATDRIVINGPSGIVIKSRVTKVAWNERYILAFQYPLISEEGDVDVDEVDAGGDAYPDKKNPNYWIINSENDIVFGPYNEEEFKDKRAEFEISEDLKLRPVEDFKN
ncbi:MAG: DUF3997 domain-containing protein [Desulfotomaculum sp.]|nr:DUF3997 domain-containing protein [Desulfotomaculum sp.]